MSEPDDVVIRGSWFVPFLLIALGCAIALAPFVLPAHLGARERIAFVVFGAMFVAPGVGILLYVRRFPRMHANADGVRFGGKRRVPWRDVARVYSSQLDLRVPQQLISFDRTHGKRAGRVLGIGDYSVPMNASNLLRDKRPVLIAQLEELRARAGSTPGASPTP